jgi:heterodisulfide reductase subunit C
LEKNGKNMPQLGFSITKGWQIDYENSDRKLYQFVMEKEPSLLLCIGCGGCTATCTAGSFTDYNFRKLHHLLRRGETHNLEKNMKKCMLCGKCKLVCPRGVNTRNVIFTLKRAFTMVNFVKAYK